MTASLWLRPLLSAGSGGLRCVSCSLLLLFGSGSGDVQRLLLLLLPPSAPSPPAALSPSHTLPAPSASTPPTTSSLPAAPPHPAAASASHPPLQPAAPPPQPPSSRTHDPLWQPQWIRSKLRPAAPGPSCPPIRDSLVFLPPLMNSGVSVEKRQNGINTQLSAKLLHSGPVGKWDVILHNSS